ncbi:MAG: hypothetical protein MRY83_03855 [Flavobacteriales bacterium]|nr:hypothetical protein [Flavobacteriales bacterium]
MRNLSFWVLSILLLGCGPSIEEQNNFYMAMVQKELEYLEKHQKDYRHLLLKWHKIEDYVRKDTLCFIDSALGKPELSIDHWSEEFEDISFENEQGYIVYDEELKHKEKDNAYFITLVDYGVSQLKSEPTGTINLDMDNAMHFLNWYFEDTSLVRNFKSTGMLSRPQARYAYLVGIRHQLQKLINLKYLLVSKCKKIQTAKAIFGATYLPGSYLGVIYLFDFQGERHMNTYEFTSGSSSEIRYYKTKNGGAKDLESAVIFDFANNQKRARNSCIHENFTIVNDFPNH